MIPAPVIALIVAALLIFTDITVSYAMAVRLRPHVQGGAQ